MIRKYKDYIILLIVFLLIVFTPYINKIIYSFNNDLNIENITNNYCISLENDYNELLEINEFNIANNFNLIVSKVYLRDIYDFTNTLTIYKGTNSGLKEGLAVINNSGLIGTIKSVSDEASVVELITSKNSNISVRINDNYGILKMDNGVLVVKDLVANSDISIGDEIYTSGLGNLPSDIYVGKVINVSLNNTEIEKIIEVEPAVDLNNINYILVVS